jgi:hypothetical protein
MKEPRMKNSAASLLLALALTACRQAETYKWDEAPTANEIAALEAPANAAKSIAPGEPGGLPDHRNLVVEGPIDPKSGQGAGQVLQSYAALLEQGRLAEARRLWTDGGAGSGLSQQGFEEALAKYTEIHAEIGAPGPVEGAAGSAYSEIPVRFYGKLKAGSAFSSVGSATLRRVNDVPGSSDEQRRWHIYRIDVQPAL